MPTPSPDFREHCYRCFKPAVVCVCASIASVSNRTHVRILQHWRERAHPIGTARFARLGLGNCRVEVQRLRDGESVRAPSSLATGPLPAGAALLFPGERARAIESIPDGERPEAIIVLDGTWRHARWLLRHNPWLDALPQVTLDAPTPSNYRIRAEPRPTYISTLEAIVATLRVLEPELADGLDGLLTAFDGMVDTQIAWHAAARAEREAQPTGHVGVAL